MAFIYFSCGLKNFYLLFNWMIIASFCWLTGLYYLSLLLINGKLLKKKKRSPSCMLEAGTCEHQITSFTWKKNVKLFTNVKCCYYNQIFLVALFTSKVLLLMLLYIREFLFWNIGILLESLCWLSGWFLRYCCCTLGWNIG